MTRNYQRSEIYSFFDLSEEQVKQILDYYNNEEEAQEDSFVILNNEPLPLSQFMRTTNNKFTHGIFSDSYFSGYFITLSKDCQDAVIAYKYF
jgi:hypothetical protein